MVLLLGGGASNLLVRACSLIGGLALENKKLPTWWQSKFRYAGVSVPQIRKPLDR